MRFWILNVLGAMGTPMPTGSFMKRIKEEVIAEARRRNGFKLGHQKVIAIQCIEFINLQLQERIQYQYYHTGHEKIVGGGELYNLILRRDPRIKIYKPVMLDDIDDVKIKTILEFFRAKARRVVAV